MKKNMSGLNFSPWKPVEDQAPFMNSNEVPYSDWARSNAVLSNGFQSMCTPIKCSIKGEIN